MAEYGYDCRVSKDSHYDRRQKPEHAGQDRDNEMVEKDERKSNAGVATPIFVSRDLTFQQREGHRAVVSTLATPSRAARARTSE